ncbi:DUF4189 domain-containing protein [Lysobacter pythonis]|uniref:DUF4189 domain-containing protein n=1 Tax=Solilutibacter pythonis TaxID=2483112 RepID=A0A3M2HJ64_9GAMM|nr:DUF4189 domain-containing protein [Lysobacter pythonis]RMH87409.1 DUF4189 domain-containing protein [Lysobacter pythonis]
MVVNKKQGATFVVLMLFIFAIPSEINAQAPPSGPCPPGAVPIPGQGRCGSPAEASAINSGGKGNPAPVYTEVWGNRFGAIAVDYDKAKSGFSEGEKSQRVAERMALQQCGTRNCKVVSWVKNGCQAAVYGNEWATYGINIDVQVAEEEAMNKCARRGVGVCKVEYSGCSLPVRVK